MDWKSRWSTLYNSNQLRRERKKQADKKLKSNALGFLKENISTAFSWITGGDGHFDSLSVTKQDFYSKYREYGAPPLAVV